MTSTIMFSGVDDGAKLSSRVLKPPGGGSSISFEEDVEVYRRHSSSSSSASSSPAPSTPPTEVKKLGNNFDVEPIPNNAKDLLLTPLKTPEPVKIPEQNVVTEKKENGSVSPVQEVKTNGSVETKTTSEQSVKENVVVQKSVEETVTQTKMTEAVTEKLQSIVLKNDVNGIVHSGSNSPSTNGHNRFSSASTSGSVSPVPSLSTPDGKTPRVVRDHMKSRIFTSDEDWTPTRTSRMNNATINDETFRGGQRQRIPPGGYSSKLW